MQIRNRFGLYDEVTEVPSPVLPGVTLRLRQCNWVRFLRYSLVYSDAVNVVATKSPAGEPTFELIKVRLKSTPCVRICWIGAYVI